MRGPCLEASPLAVCPEPEFGEFPRAIPAPPHDIGDRWDGYSSVVTNAERSEADIAPDNDGRPRPAPFDEFPLSVRPDQNEGPLAVALLHDGRQQGVPSPAPSKRAKCVIRFYDFCGKLDP